jgi:putative nucleotidyltransferase with HDIG domain
VDCATAAQAWLRSVLSRGNDKDSLKKFLTFSAGVSSYPSAASNVEELLTYANMAVYTAKTGGKNRIVLYDPAASRHDPEQAGTDKRQIAENCAATIYALTAAIDAKDHYTFNHSIHVSEYAAALAAAIPLDEEHVEIIRQAGLLHDIGKIGIPEAILSKTSRLTPEEYTAVKQHVEGSIAMIRYLPSLDYVIPSAIGHHERWDGKGYPRGIAGEAIPIGARCLCIADSFDAMISRRSYKDAMSVDAALGEIRRNLGTQFDPELGQLFIRLVEEGKIKPVKD